MEKHLLSLTRATPTRTASLKSRSDPLLLLMGVAKSPRQKMGTPALLVKVLKLAATTTIVPIVLRVSFSAASSVSHELDEDDELKTPLYDGADVSVLDSYLLVYQFALKHGLSKMAIDELIRLLSTHLPRSSKAATSLHTLEKYFAQSLEITVEVHRYCDTCHRLMEAESDRCENGCQSTIRTFVAVPIDLQLKKKLEGN